MSADDSPSKNRQQNRERITADIMKAARRQLAEVGAAGLSLRSIAREIGMVSSAVYRYLDSRDELLTRLIVEAYDSLGAAVERASTANADAGDITRWTAAGLAARRWALRRPHEYLLLYGSPVPGYAAPADTAGPGTRVPLALVEIVRDAWAADRLVTTDTPRPTGLTDDLARLAALLELPVDQATLVAVIGGWTQMFGLISFELTNQTRGVVTDHAGLFQATVQQSGHRIGLR